MACLATSSRLWELAVTGTAGKAHADSGIRVLERCEACGAVESSSFRSNGIIVDEERWDGSDFFLTEEYDDQGNYIGPPLDELEEKLKRFPFEDSGLGE